MKNFYFANVRINSNLLTNLEELSFLVVLALPKAEHRKEVK